MQNFTSESLWKKRSIQQQKLIRLSNCTKYRGLHRNAHETNDQFSSRSLSGKVTVPNTGVYVEGLMEQTVNSAAEAYEIK